MHSYKNTVGGWSSVTFHCGTGTNPRILCAELTTDLTACNGGAVPTSNPTPSISPSSTPAPTNLGQETEQYCATLNAGQAGGASGYFALQLSGGEAKYAYNVDLTNFEYLSGICSSSLATGGLKYHIHAYWKNTTTTSSAGSGYCGSALTGGHYDPNFGCSSASQNAAGGCTSLSRTAALGYTYSCNSTVYGAGEYSDW